MLSLIKSMLSEEGIELSGVLPLEECIIKRPYLLEREGISHGSVIIVAVPYLSREAMKKRNVSYYAVAQDYHLFFKYLFDKILGALRERYPENRFAAFSDHSPIDEIDAAARAGLGVVGKNRMLITEKYSSFVFLGEIITDAALPYTISEKRYCCGCNKCINECPVGADVDRCLSALTQKKGELTEEEATLISKSGLVWGCDICQEVCPHTKAAIQNGTAFSNIEFFNSRLTPYITANSLSSLSDKEFSERAYSWRGRNTILRNLLIWEEKHTEQK